MGPCRDPNFILIGSMKSGTTSLYQYLSRHPQVFLCSPKEPQFFSRDHVYCRGIEWYRSLFADAVPSQVCGEASTCYTRWPHFGDVPARISQHLPNVKFIYIMRHPVDRAYSHYRHLMEERHQAAEPLLSFEAALDAIPEIIDTSLYLRQIERYLTYFSMNRFLFLTLDQLGTHPRAVLEKVQEFIGVEQVDLVAGGEVTANPWGTIIAAQDMKAALKRMRSTPGLSGLIGLIPRSLRRKVRALLTRPSFAWVVARNRVRKHANQLLALDPGTRERLSKQFAEPTRELGEFLGRDLVDWST